MAGKRRRTKKRETTIARRRRAAMPAAAGEPPLSLSTLILDLNQAVVEIGASVKTLTSDRVEAKTEHRQMADRLVNVDNRLGQVESIAARIEPVVWKLETDKQRAIGGRALLGSVFTRGRVLVAIAISAGGTVAGWFGHAAVNAPPVKLP